MLGATLSPCNTYTHSCIPLQPSSAASSLQCLASSACSHSLCVSSEDLWLGSPRKMSATVSDESAPQQECKGQSNCRSDHADLRGGDNNIVYLRNSRDDRIVKVRSKFDGRLCLKFCDTKSILQCHQFNLPSEVRL